MRLSVCMIVKNEQAVLERCLNCVKHFADEIIIVDTGSSDSSRDIARRFTPLVYSFEWCDDFSKARNYSLDRASGDYLMWLDADDVITKENAEKINTLKCEQFDMAYLKYCTAFEGERATFVYFRERIFRRACGFRFVGAVHEVVVPSGKVIYCNAEIHHKKVKAADSFRNLNILQKQIALGICLDERQKFYLARELYANNLLVQALAVYENFLSGDGWVENKIQAHIDLYYILSKLGEDERAIGQLLRALDYGFPKPQICCILGERALERGDNNSAIFWYETALLGKKLVYDGGFFDLNYCGFIPYMQLCLIYDRLGEFERASAYNDLAGKIKPEHAAYLQNKSYFNSIFKGQT